MTSFKERWENVSRRIEVACRDAGRNRDEVKVVAVSKKQAMDRLNEAYALGIRDFGENYAQALSQRMAEMPPDIRWHMIGHLQTNKVRLLSDRVFSIHTVHSEKLVRRIVGAGERQHPIEFLLQVNIGEEPQKSGVTPGELPTLLEALQNQNITGLEGLMAIPPRDDNPRRWFAALRELRDQMAQRFEFALPTLSMGMSADFEDAIREGANLVRLGTVLFGPRPS
ncbi:MAG: YggS family pyridoxal phosphate-dependent enzyme [Myxococcota bacterium]|nr:YggS family pyridoxal phosphate-dependent enzyme [Myxococcota bacterium]